MGQPFLDKDVTFASCIVSGKTPDEKDSSMI